MPEAVVRESPLEVFGHRAWPRSNTEGRGGEFQTSFFEFSVVFSQPIIADEEDLSDDDLVEAATLSGSFEFLNSPEEDIYTVATKPAQ